VYANRPISQQYLDSFILSNFRPKQEKQWFREIPGVCYWWDRHVFGSDDSNFELSLFKKKKLICLRINFLMTNLETMRAVAVLSFISCGVLFVVFVLFIASLFKRFRSYKIDYIIASLLLLNGMLEKKRIILIFL